MNPIKNLKDLIVYQSQNNETISVEVNTIITILKKPLKLMIYIILELKENIA